MADDRFYATGKRKTSVARVWLAPGQGKIEINKRTIEDYFGRETLRMVTLQPMAITGTMGRFDLYILTNGGGPTGQAGAIRHGISKALEQYDPNLRGVLKRAGFMTRDARKKERKKYGQKGARARYQYSKR
jgi:small subunit ribosomal protein S9